MKRDLSRREFLKAGMKASVGGFFAINSLLKTPLAGDIDPTNPLLGRVFHDDAIIYKKPSYSSEIGYYLKMNNVLPLGNEVLGDAINAHNRSWYEVPNYGYLPANSIQLVHQRTTAVQDQISPAGELGVISVPYTKAWAANPSNEEDYRLFFYGSTHWLKGVYSDNKGDFYYKVIEDRWGDVYYVEANHVALVSEKDLLPFATDIPAGEKMIEVSIRDQMVIAYEYGKAVFMSVASTGVLDDGIDLSTPPGHYKINYKRASRHMVHSDKTGSNDNELYGVPWVSYFTSSGIAFHGTYWHNDFGIQKSHGCVNLPIQAAKWIYLWSQPVVPPSQEKFVSNHGTPVMVT